MADVRTTRTIEPDVAVGAPAVSMGQAFDLVGGWLARPDVVMVEPTQRHLAHMRELLGPLGVAGRLASDAHLAMGHGATLESSDHDFGRFAGLRWEDPLRARRRADEGSR